MIVRVLIPNCIDQVFQSAVQEAKKFKSSGGDILSDMLDLLGDKVSSTNLQFDLIVICMMCKLFDAFLPFKM